jgi:5-methylcytosine-specific restriction enzyme A
VTLENIRARRAELAVATAAIESTPHYFPFELKSKREVRPLQGYAFKVPRAALNVFPELAQATTGTYSPEAPGVPVAAPAEESRRNPAWSRDELILALDLYIKTRAALPGTESVPIRELSAVQNALGAMLGGKPSATYRNANGVYMKLMNFRRLDPDYTGDGRLGLRRGNADEEVVWAEFASDPARLAAVAAAIRDTIQFKDLGGAVFHEPEVQEAPEGMLLTRVHRYRERRLVEACKARALKINNRLHCWACGFDFRDRYGRAGEGIIDCHHTRPVHTLLPGDKTKVSDLVLLCANCHRVVHAHSPWLTLDQLKDVLNCRRS